MFKILHKNLFIGIVVFFSLCGLTAWHVNAAIPAAERAALIALYNSTDGDNWNDSSGWKEPPLDVDGFSLPGTENTWFGITTDAGNASVTQINLRNNQLLGSIPPELGNLSGLQSLSLHRNQLSGDIPAELGNLANLQGIILEFNQLTGTIPVQLGNLTNLINLDLQWNQLTGNIPTELGNLTDLEGLDLRLSLNHNQLTGDIPAELGNLSNLRVLWLHNNQLTGNIPAELGNLIDLATFNINSNMLIGAIPMSLINLSGLSNTDIGYNALYTDNTTLDTFLNDEDPDWKNTQTVAPENVTASTTSDTSIDVSWTPIIYTADSGGYQVFYSISPGGPYTLFGSTTDKSTFDIEVTGLNPGTTYFFVVKTRTDPHMQNQNTVDSENSQETTATTTGDSGDGGGGGGGGCFIDTASDG
jgi:hypothetical protein